MRRDSKKIRGVIAAVAYVGMLAVPLPAAAVDSAPPKIVGATTVDADHDNRADRVVLKYSERINHALDTDGRYPFRVGNYRIKRSAPPAGREC